MTIDVGLNPPIHHAQAHPNIIFGAKIWVKIFFDQNLFSLTIDDVIHGDDSHELSQPKCSDQLNSFICPDPGYVYPGINFPLKFFHFHLPRYVPSTFYSLEGLVYPK